MLTLAERLFVETKAIIGISAEASTLVDDLMALMHEHHRICMEEAMQEQFLPAIS